MSRFIEGEERSQSVLFPESLDEWITEDNPVRVVDAFVEELDLAGRQGKNAVGVGATAPPTTVHGAADLRGRIGGKARAPATARPPARASQVAQTTSCCRPPR